MTNKSIKVGILGASGYTGSELIRLILKHPNLNLEFAIPLTFIAIILPKLKSISHCTVAATASIIAIFGQVLPYSLWIIVASIVGMFVGGYISKSRSK